MFFLLNNVRKLWFFRESILKPLEHHTHYPVDFSKPLNAKQYQLKKNRGSSHLELLSSVF